MSRRTTPERKALVSRAARLVHHHGAPYAAVAKHCQLPIGTVACEVRRYRLANGLRPTRVHGKAKADWLRELQNFHK